MGTNASIRFLVLACSLFVVGCSAGGDAQSKRVVPADVYDQAACEALLPETGNQALFSNASRDEIKTANYFGKKYDAADLEAVYNASAVSTADYVKRLGVGLYKIPRTKLQHGKKLCQMYHFLNEPNDSLRDLWDSIAGADHGGGALAGLYIPCLSPSCPDRSLKDPTILVDEGSDRWTLVHEMMHHNFAKTRNADPMTKPRRTVEAEMERAFDKLKRAVQKYEANPNRSDLMDAAIQVDVITKSLYDSLVRSSLEEIAIESMMIDDYMDQKLSFVGRESAQSASWYIERSRDLSLERLKEVDNDLIGTLLMEAESFFWDDVRDQLKSSREFIRGVRQETAEMVNRACQRTRRPNCQLVTNPRLQVITAAMVAMTHPHADHVDAQGPGLKTFDKEMAELSEKFGF